jgi:hypothetical protein
MYDLVHRPANGEEGFLFNDVAQFFPDNKPLKLHSTPMYYLLNIDIK